MQPLQHLKVSVSLSFTALPGTVMLGYEPRLALTVLCASDLCQDAEGARLRGTSAWAPILRVLDQSLFTGIAQVRTVVHHQLGICDRLPGNSRKRKVWHVIH